MMITHFEKLQKNLKNGIEFWAWRLSLPPAFFAVFFKLLQNYYKEFLQKSFLCNLHKRILYKKSSSFCTKEST